MCLWLQVVQVAVDTAAVELVDFFIKPQGLWPLALITQ
jgi:hypothetical protein